MKSLTVNVVFHVFIIHVYKQSGYTSATDGELFAKSSLILVAITVTLSA